MLFVSQSKSGYPAFFIVSTMLAALVVYLGDLRFQSLFILGLVLGASFNFYQFGFTKAWHDLVANGATEGVRSHFIAIGVGTLLLTPFLLQGSFAGLELKGLVRPIGVSVVLGAFLFGVGMQLAGSCSSGTFVNLGQFYPLSTITLLGMFAGGLSASFFFEYWMSWPMIQPLSFTLELGYFGLAVNLLLVLLVYFALAIWDKENRLRPGINADNQSIVQWLYTSPTLVVASILIALASLGVLLASGQPWSIASVFTLWSLKFSELIRLNLGWEFWSVSTVYGARMYQPLLEDPITLTTVGFICGAVLVTMLGNRTVHRNAFNLRRVLFSILGGLLMGVGATIAFGCNIGAFMSGIMSGSLHGWLWIFWAALGNVVAIKFILKRQT